MENSCGKQNENPYFACRKQAAIYNDSLNSREKTAEMLGISVSTLSNYEVGITVPPVDIIMMMADLYRAPQLKAMYCKNQCLIGKEMPIAVCSGRIDNIAVRIIKQFNENRIESIVERLIGIAEDGKVSSDEAETLKSVCSELDEIMKTAWELRLIQERGCDDGRGRKN